MIKLTLKEFLDENNISRYQVAKLTGIQYQIIDNYYKNKVVRYDSYVLDKLCTVLHCEISDLIVYEK